MLDRAARRVSTRREPFYSAWQHAAAAADEALTEPFEPDNGPDIRTFFRTGRAHAFASRHLAFAHRITGEERYAHKAAEILLGWSRDAARHPTPARGSLRAHGTVLGRVLPVFCDTYATLHAQLTLEQRAEIESWLGSMVPVIQSSQAAWEAHEDRVGADLAAQNLGLVSIGYVLGDRDLLNHVLVDASNPYYQPALMAALILMSGEQPDEHRRRLDPTYTDDAPAPVSGEMYDRFMHPHGSGVHYALLSLRFLALVAEAAHNNRRVGTGEDAACPDLYGWTGPNGENLELPFGVYADLEWTADEADRVNNGYYTGDHVTFRDVPMYELAHMRYLKNERIAGVLRRHRRVVEDLHTFGWTAILTHGLDDDAPAS